MPPDPTQVAITALANRLILAALVGADARIASHTAERAAELEADRAAYLRAGLDGPARTLGETMMLAGIGPAARRTEAEFVELVPAEDSALAAPPVPVSVPIEQPDEPAPRGKKSLGRAGK